MADGIVQVAPDSTGKKVDTSEITVGANTVERQRVVIGDPSSATGLAGVTPLGGLQVQGVSGATTFSGVSTVSVLASTACGYYNVVTLTLRTFTGTTPSITFKLQATDDNTNWVDIQGINNQTGLVASSWTQPAALAAGTAALSIDYTIGAYTNVRINVTAISGTTPSAAFGLSFQTMPYEASPGALCQGLGGSLGNPVMVSLGCSTGKTNVMKTGALASSATTADQVILTYTVTAGKTFYLCYLDIDARLTTFAATATYFGLASLENPSGTKLLSQMKAGTGVTTDPHYDFPEPVPISAGTVIRVVCTPSAATAFSWQASFGGYEK